MEGQLGQLPGETVLYRIDVVSLAKQYSQYGLQIIGTVSLLNSERAPAIYHLNLHLRNGLKTLKPAIINSWFTLSEVLPFFLLYLLLSIYFLKLFSVFSCILFVL